MKHIKIKLIALSLIIVLVGAGVALSLSRALFEDRQVLDTTISMGTLNLQVGDYGPASIPLDFQNMVPGEFRTVIFEVDNIGSVEGNFWVRGEIISAGEGENPANEPETESDGDLHNCARLSLFRMKDNGLFDNVVNNMLIRNIETEFEIESGTETDADVNNGPAEMHLVVNTLECGNETMGDVLTADLSLYLTQVVEE